MNNAEIVREKKHFFSIKSQMYKNNKAYKRNAMFKKLFTEKI